MNTQKKRIYVAGPDVFKPDAKMIYKKYASVCEQYHVECLYPNDDVIEFSNDKKIFSSNIYHANLKMLNQADAVIVNIEPTYGPCMDVGAAFEVGYAKAKKLPVFGFCTYVTPDYFERLKQYHGDIITNETGSRSKKTGMLLEDFELPDNLMLAYAIDCVVHHSFEAALHEAIRIYRA